MSLQAVKTAQNRSVKLQDPIKTSQSFCLSAFFGSTTAKQGIKTIKPQKKLKLMKNFLFELKTKRKVGSTLQSI